MLESIVSAVFVAAISAIVFVAYRHPMAFAKLHSSVKRPLGLLAVGAVAWALGDSGVRTDIRSSLSKVIPANVEAQNAIRSLLDKEPPFVWIFLGLGGVWLFLEALAALPRLGITGETPVTPQEQHPKPRRDAPPTADS